MTEPRRIGLLLANVPDSFVTGWYLGIMTEGEAAMVRFTIFILLFVAFIVGCSDNAKSNGTPAANASANSSLIVVDPTDALFDEKVKLSSEGYSKEWDKKYIGKTVRLKVYFSNGSNTKAMFMLQPAKTGAMSARELQKSIQEAALQRTVTVTKKETVDMSKFMTNDAVTIEVIVKEMEQATNLIGECIKAEKN